VDVVASEYVELLWKVFVQMMKDDQDNTLSQAEDRYVVLDDGLDQILA